VSAAVATEAGCGGCGAGPRPAAARGAAAAPVFVNGAEIPEEAIAAEAQNHPAASPGEARAMAARALVIRALLLNRAHERGLVPDPEADAGGRRETEEEALIRQLFEAELAPEEPAEAACRLYYRTHALAFTAPALIEASHILFEPRAGLADAEEQARAALATIGGDDARFRALARARSDCPSGASGGSLGQLRPGDLAPEVEGALAALAPGEIAPDPVVSRFGVHLLRLDRREAARRLPYEAVAARIRDRLAARAWTTAAARHVAALAASARIEGLTLEATGS
jgi:peptidyl-prolyl cis-trans isomerase C